jgi:hypothetical protein
MNIELTLLIVLYVMGFVLAPVVLWNAYRNDGE